MDVPDLRGIDRADVYKAGRTAGHLLREQDVVTFAYRQDYLDDPSAPAVAFTLPKSSERYRATGGSVPPFFAGLLPEGARLTAITTAAKTSDDDHFSILLAVGADTIGDVQVLPEGHLPVTPSPVFTAGDSNDADFTELFQQATTSDPVDLDRTGLPGVQVKVSAQMISTRVTTERGPAILKLNPPEYPRLVENEDFFLRMAAACGIDVPNHRLATDRYGRAALFVERFDRITTPRGIERLAQEDACQVLGRYPAAKYRISLQEAIIGLSDAVRTGAGSAPLATRRTLAIAAFSYLIGNGDLHGKNLSVRRSREGVWEVTPAYDLLTTQPYLGWNDPMALALYGRAAKLTYRWWAAAAARLGVPKRALDRDLARIVDAAESWDAKVPSIGFDEPTTDRLTKMLVARREELRPT
ncbi:type II toxin-antitoxin system HipA family toxin [Nocardia sp. NPDC055053]